MIYLYLVFLLYVVFIVYYLVIGNNVLLYVIVYCVFCVFYHVQYWTYGSLFFILHLVYIYFKVRFRAMSSSVRYIHLYL